MNSLSQNHLTCLLKCRFPPNKMQGLRHWNQICIFSSNPPSQRNSCGCEKLRLSYLQNGPWAKPCSQLALSVVIKPLFCMLPFFFTFDFFPSLQMFQCNEFTLTWLSPVTWFVTFPTLYMEWLRIERWTKMTSLLLVDLWPLQYRQRKFFSYCHMANGIQHTHFPPHQLALLKH